MLTPEQEARFWSHVARAGDDACWNWTASCKYGGYGQFNVNGKNMTATRVSLELSTGECGEDALHSCHNPLCVNPKHLRWGTAKDNMLDKVRAGRQHHPQGSKCGMSKLTEDQVTLMRQLHGEKTYKQLAELFGITTKQVCKIVTRKQWTHV